MSGSDSGMKTRGEKRPREEGPPPTRRSSRRASARAPSLASDTSQKKRKKLTQEEKNVLLAWYNDNEEHPYPDSTTKARLAEATGQTIAQVEQWYINTRKRDGRRKSKPNFHKKRAADRARDLAKASQGNVTEEEALRVATMPTDNPGPARSATPEPEDQPLISRTTSALLHNTLGQLQSASQLVLATPSPSTSTSTSTPSSEVDSLAEEEEEEVEGGVDVGHIVRTATLTTTTAAAFAATEEPMFAQEAAEAIARRADAMASNVAAATQLMVACVDTVTLVTRVASGGGDHREVTEGLKVIHRRLSELTENGRPLHSAMQRTVYESRLEAPELMEAVRTPVFSAVEGKVATGAVLLPAEGSLGSPAPRPPFVPGPRAPPSSMAASFMPNSPPPTAAAKPSALKDLH